MRRIQEKKQCECVSLQFQQDEKEWKGVLFWSITKVSAPGTVEDNSIDLCDEGDD